MAGRGYSLLRCRSFSCGASLVVEHRLWSTGSVVEVHRAELLQDIWDLPGPGIGPPVSPAWQADFYPLDHQGSPLNFEKFQTYREVARIHPDFSTVNSFFSLYIYTYSFCWTIWGTVIGMMPFLPKILQHAWLKRKDILLHNHDTVLSENTALICCCSVAHSCPTLRPRGLQHARLPCPSLSSRACSDSCPVNQWYHPTISSSLAPCSACLQSFQQEMIM